MYVHTSDETELQKLWDVINRDVPEPCSGSGAGASSSGAGARVAPAPEPEPIIQCKFIANDGHRKIFLLDNFFEVVESFFSTVSLIFGRKELLKRAQLAAKRSEKCRKRPLNHRKNWIWWPLPRLRLRLRLRWKLRLRHIPTLNKKFLIFFSYFAISFPAHVYAHATKFFWVCAWISKVLRRNIHEKDENDD